MKPKVAIILLTWQRINNLKNTLSMLSSQSYKDFDVFVSNANFDPNKMATIEKYVSHFKNELNISLSNDGNDLYTFRRLTLARDLANRGYEIIIYIDDDVIIKTNYIKVCIEQYEPNTYKSSYAWSFYNSGQSYYKGRIRRKNNNEIINYCGSGAAMIDASIFLEDGLFDYPEGSLKIEDLWLSFYAQHVMNWKLMYINVDVNVTGRDEVALFRQVKKEKINKDVFLRTLVDLGWKLPD